MKSLRIVLAIALVSVATAALAQSDSQKSFDKMKALAGIWQGAVHTDSKDDHEMEGTLMKVSLRITSRGNAILHEMKQAGTADDPTRYDNPITMLYVDGDRLYLTHYCDAGNRPRMTGNLSPDGKKVAFDLVDVSGGTQYGHMQSAVFTVIDANHHTEDWTYMEPGDKPVHAHMELTRAN